MPSTRPDGDERDKPAARRAVRRGMLGMAGYLLVLAASMFLPAGRLGWTRGWAFLVAFTVLNLAAVCYLWRTNPEVVVARSTPHRGTKPWDKALFLLINVMFLAIFPIAALDDARFHWSAAPLWLTLAGYVLFVAAMAGITWVLRTNKFAEPSVRIQTERHHQVIDTGPYAIVRHPFYAAAFLLCGGMPLAMGSLWALVPGAVAALLLIVRTACEDRTLHNELDGYKQYAARVRYRLIPGVW
jgi:protein-S-isoprenylcysteine O-methyltransferase Ste14